MTRYRCPGCGYVYDEARGDAHEGFAPGTRWAQIPRDWACPDCSVNEKADFKVVAGEGALGPGSGPRADPSADL